VVEPGVTSIGDNAFNWYYRNLTNINLPKGLTSIGEYAFQGCDMLKSIGLPDELVNIGVRAFYDSGIETINLPEGLTSIGEEAFSRCYGLRYISLPDSLKTIEEGTFYMSGLESIFMPEGLVSIGEGAFSDCWSLTDINIPETVTSIGDAAFFECGSITNVWFSDNSSLTSIGSKAFSGCRSLTHIWIPKATCVGSGAFSGCTELSFIAVEDGNKYHTSIDGVLFNKDCTQLIQYPAAAIGSYYSVPDSVTAIGANAFHGCENLTQIDLPDGLTNIGEEAFSNCASLMLIYIPDGVTSIESSTFYGCSSLINVDLPAELTKIGNGAFYECSSLIGVILPESVASIEAWAFAHCDSLTSVHIPASVTNIGSRAFYDCDALKDAYFYGNAPIVFADSFPSDITLHYYKGKNGWNTPTWNGYKTQARNSDGSDASDEPEIDNNIIANGVCGDNLTWTITSDGLLTISGSGEMWYFYSSAPWDTFDFDRVVITEGVESIGVYAFVSCDITSVELPESLKSIEFGAFWGCVSLTSINIPRNVTYIDVGFIGQNLESVYFEGDAPEVAENSFGEATLYYPEGAKGWTTPNWNGYKAYPYTPNKPTEPEIDTTPVTALVSPQKFEMDGERIDIGIYNIGDKNYFKLRDIAALVNGSGKQFSIGWDGELGVATLTSGEAYKVLDTDLQPGGGVNKQATESTATVVLNGEVIKLAAYNIDGYTYYQLRDLCKALDIKVTWDSATGTIGIDPTQGY